MRRTLRIAAIQLHSEIGDVKKNLLNCEQLADAAGKAGAKWIVLPEFFTTGMGFTPKLKNTALPADGPATELLLSIARRYQANVGGSFLCRDADFHIRNAFLLASPTGIVGRHDKDEPTLWENCWYIGGADDGRLDVNGIKVGVALCAELGRTATAKRLSGVDLVLAGSYTWHLPDYFPGWLGRHRLDRKLFSEISSWASPFARLVGAPIVEATHCGTLECRDQLLPISYRCPIGDGTKICASDGTILASRQPSEGAGVVIADVEVGSVSPIDPMPRASWIRSIGFVGNAMWALQRVHGRHWYKKHAIPPGEHR